MGKKMYLCRQTVQFMNKRILLLTTTILTFTSLSFAQDQAPMVLQYDLPATYFEESLPIGNGKIGALAQRSHLTHELHMHGRTQRNTEKTESS